MSPNAKRRSNLIPGIGLMIVLAVSFSLLPLGLVVIFLLFYGRERMDIPWLDVYTPAQLVWMGTAGLAVLVVILRAVFVVCTRRIAANNRWNAGLRDGVSDPAATRPPLGSP